MTAKLFEILDKEQSILKQRSRVKWINNGDQTTSFHHAVKIHQAGKSLKFFRIEGKTCNDMDVIPSHIVYYYKNIPCGVHSFILDGIYPIIHTENFRRPEQESNYGP